MQELLHILFGGERGGCESDAYLLVRGLPAVRHRVLVLGPPGPMCDDWRRAGAVVDVVQSDGSAHLVDVIREFTKQHPPSAAMIWHGLVHLPQIVHALNPLGIPIGVHGGNPAHTMPRWVDWKYELLGYLFPPDGPLPTYICCSHYVADSFETSRYLRRCPRVVVPNGVELPSGRTHAVRPFRPTEPFNIGMVARLSSIKDHATLLQAFALVSQQFPNARLMLAGDGNEKERLTRLVSDLGVSESVRFLGDVSDVYRLMESWDLFAYATTEREGMGNAVAEAMIFGLPCVVTDVGPTHEFAGDGSAVRLVRPHDPGALAAAIGELIPDEAGRAALSAAARNWAQARYHPAKFARRYAEVLGFPETEHSQLLSPRITKSAVQ